MVALTNVIEEKTMKKEYYHPGVVMRGQYRRKTELAINKNQSTKIYSSRWCNSFITFTYFYIELMSFSLEICSLIQVGICQQSKVKMSPRPSKLKMAAHLQNRYTSVSAACQQMRSLLALQHIYSGIVHGNLFLMVISFQPMQWMRHMTCLNGNVNKHGVSIKKFYQ